MPRIQGKTGNGFTLIELSIVLVIIGLIIGGVLVGKDLLKAAEIRSFVSQIESYKTAVNTFKSKYGSLPGDMLPTTASNYGFAARIGGLGLGNNDGILQGNNISIGLGALNACGENVWFWNDLGVAQLIKGQYFGGNNDSYNAAWRNNCIPAVPDSVIPLGKINKGNYIIAYGDPNQNTNYFQTIGGVTDIGGHGEYNGSSVGITPTEAYNIDNKTDDGSPLTGKVVARLIPTNNGSNSIVVPSAPTPAAPANTVCVSNATSNPYNVDPANGGNSLACSLRFDWGS